MYSIEISKPYERRNPDNPSKKITDRDITFKHDHGEAVISKSCWDKLPLYLKRKYLKLIGVNKDTRESLIIDISKGEK